MNITKINVNGEEYYIKDTISGYTSFEWNPTITSGDVVGTMEFNGATYTVYAPVQSMSNTLDIEVNGTDLTITHGGGGDITENWVTIVDNNVVNWEPTENDTLTLINTSTLFNLEYGEYGSPLYYDVKMIFDNVEYSSTSSTEIDAGSEYRLFYFGGDYDGSSLPSVYISWVNDTFLDRSIGGDETHGGDELDHTVTIMIDTMSKRSNL